MWPDRVSNPRPPTYESGAVPTALRGPAPGELKTVPTFHNTCIRMLAIGVCQLVSLQVQLLHMIDTAKNWKKYSLCNSWQTCLENINDRRV